MDWILGEFKFRGHDFKAWHFDVSAGEGSNADAPRLSGDEEDALEDATGEIGAVLWSEAAIACLQHLQDIKKSYAGCKVLELGAGCGFVGLALAADGAKVTITDLEALHPLLDLNAKLQMQEGRIVDCCTLDWSKPIPSCLKPDYDLVVGCDLLYDSASPTELLGVLQYFVIGDTEFRLSVNLRDHGKGLRHLLELMEGDFLCSITDMPGVSILVARRR